MQFDLIQLTKNIMWPLDDIRISWWLDNHVTALLSRDVENPKLNERGFIEVYDYAPGTMMIYNELYDVT